MTKKDYIVIAEAIIDAITGKDPNGETVNLNGSLLERWVSSRSDALRRRYRPKRGTDR